MTVWLQTLLLPQASLALQVRVAANVPPQKPAVFVIVLSTATVTLAPPQLSAPAVGASKAQSAPHSTVFPATQTSVGAVVSTTVTVWLQTLLLPQASAALQVRVAANVPRQKPAVFVIVLSTATVTLAPPQISAPAVGASKAQSAPHSTVFPATQTSVGAVVSTTVTV